MESGGKADVDVENVTQLRVTLFPNAARAGVQGTDGGDGAESG